MSRTLIWSKIKWMIDHCQKYQIQCIFTSPLPKKALHYFESITIWCRFHHLQLHAWWVSDPSDKWRHQNRGDSWVVHCSLGHCKGSICVNNKSSLKNNLLANMTYLTCYRYMTIIKNPYSSSSYNLCRQTICGKRNMYLIWLSNQGNKIPKTFIALNLKWLTRRRVCPPFQRPVRICCISTQIFIKSAVNWHH